MPFHGQKPYEEHINEFGPDGLHDVIPQGPMEPSDTGRKLGTPGNKQAVPSESSVERTPISGPNPGPRAR